MFLCQRCQFESSSSLGLGSHVKVTHPVSFTEITIMRTLHSQGVQIEAIAKILKRSDTTVLKYLNKGSGK